MQSKENTRNRIAQACLELLNTTSLETLRAQDIMEKAGVSRSSFYRLYKDKYEVANSLYQMKADALIKEKPALKDWKEWTYVLHAYMREHKRFFRNIVSYRGQNSFNEFLCRYFICNIMKLHGNSMTDEQRFAIYAFSLIGAQATVDWIANGFNPNDETLIHRLEACMPNCIRPFYE